MSEHDPGSDGARADVCRLLSACYYEPSPAFAEERLFDSLAQAAARVDPPLGQAARQLGEAFAAEDLQTLLVDYTQLFLGPVGAPAKPYGSIWMEPGKGVMQESTVAVRALYREGGFDLAEDFLDVPDHIAVELEFLYVLNFREAAARMSGDALALEQAGALKRRLLFDHIGRWVGAFAQACSGNARTAFYGELGRMTEQFVRMEQEHVARG